MACGCVMTRGSHEQVKHWLGRSYVIGNIVIFLTGGRIGLKFAMKMLSDPGKVVDMFQPG